MTFRSIDEEHAWDRFAAAALAGVWACDARDLPTGESLGELAAEEADQLIELRRARQEATDGHPDAAR